ncbi:hypothetical protein GQ54DRAFT_296144 [Martensiomyces pterosporus]|nr:hypothetical protein GQ54DRAFT_296144 [Martensiomyces pterosporus]
MSNAFTHSISTSLPERHAAASSDPSLRTPEPHSGHRLSASLRRAKTATGNSLRKLFKGHSSSAKRSGNDAAPGAAPFLPLSSEEAQHRSPGSPLDHQHQHHTISSTPMFAKSPVLLRRYHTERRPSSSHSTKSARTIFSAAKRFRIRSSSMSYRRGSEEMDDGGLFSLDQPPLAHASASVNRGSAVPWPITIPEDSDVPTIPDQEEPSSPGCSLPVSSGQRLRHAVRTMALKPGVPCALVPFV